MPRPKSLLSASSARIGKTVLAAFLLVHLSGKPRAQPTQAPAPPLPHAPFEAGWGDAGYVAAALGLQAWAHVRYNDMPATTASQLDREDLWFMDRWAAGNFSEPAALASDILIVPLVAAPLVMSGVDVRSSGAGWGPFLTEALVYSEALALSSSLNLLVRSTRIHPRPFTYGSDAPASEQRKGEASGSFYSGHANASFLAATYLAYTHGLRNPDSPLAPALWVGALGYATTVAGLRVAAGKHFPSDILVGAAAGAGFGWLFPRLHLRGGTRGGTRNGSRLPGGASLRLLPAADGGAQALLIKRF